ncbi:MAG: hypothetical protein O3B43_06475 [Chloroflexi bacterium]|nr:hypothetical protein [Chloroflexota bacterium]
MAETQPDRDYILRRIGYALILAGNYLVGEELGAGGGVPIDEGNGVGDPDGDIDTDDDAPTDDTDIALGEVRVVSNRAPLRSEPEKNMTPDLGRLLKGEQVPLDAISEDGKWYRIWVRNFAGLHTIPEEARFAWAEADRFEILSLVEDAT